MKKFKRYVSFNQYFDCLIGQGAFGIAMKATYESAAVFIKQKKSYSPYVSDIFRKEALVLSQIKHENIIRLLGVCNDPMYFIRLHIIPRRVAILVIIFWNFTICQDRSDSPRVKGNLISSIENLAYDLPLKLPNDLRLGILGNIREISNLGGHMVQWQVPLQELRLCEQQLKKYTKTLSGIVEGGGGEICLALFRKLEKSVLILGKKCPDCGLLWVKFLI